MNERYAADPVCFSHSIELKYLLDKFGIFTGRYLVGYPDDWEPRLIDHIGTVSPVEMARISLLLRRAREQYGLIKMPKLIWQDQLSWADNAGVHVCQSPPRINGLVVPNGTREVPLKGKMLDDFDVPPTAEERFPSSPEEYVRVTKMLLLLGHELLMVDPYLDPCSQYVAPVIKALLTVIAQAGSNCKLLNIYARANNVLKDGNTVASVRGALTEMLESVVSGKSIRVIYHLIDDSRGDRMHDRYLLSVKGGIELSQGFQVQRRNAKVKASPMAPQTHRETWATYTDRQTDMRIDPVIKIVSGDSTTAMASRPS